MKRHMWRCVVLVTIAMLIVAASSCRKKTSSPVHIGVSPAVAASGLVQGIVGEFSQQNGVKTTLHVVPEDELLRLASAGALQVVFTSDASAVPYRPFARLASTFAFHDFAIYGPQSDRANVRRAATAADAFRRIAKRSARFCSAVDVPRISALERQLWKAAGIDPAALKHLAQCPGDTLTALGEADRKNAYTISEAQAGAATGTHLDIKVLLAGSPDLHDSYAVILLDHEPRRRRERDAEWLVQWIMSYQGREAVQNIRVDGVPLYSVRDLRGNP